MSLGELKFDAKTVTLAGTNLIEASAGTGKTYSIAILVLRILLEKTVVEDGQDRNISIKEILMVTFTKAAVAELEERVRQFIRKAYQVSQGQPCEDETILEIVQSAAEFQGSKKVQRKLQEAVEFLDESSVLTIHSFCQQILREFAFETRQSFTIELVTDISEIMMQALNQFWRTQIAVMPLDILAALGTKLNRGRLIQVIKDFFNGKPILNYDPDEVYLLNEAYFEQYRIESEGITKALEDLGQEISNFCLNEKELLIKGANSNSNAKKAFLHLVDEPELFKAAYLSKLKKNKAQYLKDNFGPLFEMAESLENLTNQLSDKASQQLLYIYGAAISFVEPAVNAYKEKHGQLCFDDLIEQLHVRLCVEQNTNLAAAIQKKFKVVFIDEFQDTDRKQYDIFNTAFGSHTVVFYIGDPKQSIYAWRKADIETYLKAASHVDNKYGMHINYRSSNDFIEAMNGFFMPHPQFDTFYYQNSPQGIYYHMVSAPAENKKGNLLYQGNRFAVINITQSANGQEVESALVAQIAILLGGAYEIEEVKKDENGQYVKTRRPVRPNDIGILIRKNDDAIPFKRELGRIGIPSVVIGLSKILGSEEAKEVLYVLEAIMTPSRNTINRALLGAFTGMRMQEVLDQDDVITIGRFSDYKAEWEKAGVYKALFSFIADYNVEKHLTDPETRGGERIISNLYQIIELLYKQQTSKNLSTTELIDWLRRGIEDPSEEGDEYEQRVESDDLCVTIMTIHKSKGLQFNIVLTDALDMNVSLINRNFIELKDEVGRDLILPIDMALEEDIAVYKKQQMQENRRMVYVTLTRAVYSCFIFSSKAVNKNENSAIHAFLGAFGTQPPAGIRFADPLTLSAGFRFKREMKGNKQRIAPTADQVNFNLVENDWRRLSYTYLAAPPLRHNRFDVHQVEKQYDQFVFEGLKRGNITGNLLHEIFEHIYFDQPTYWAEVIEKAVSRYAPHDSELYKEMLMQLLQHVSGATINTGQYSFSLSQMDSNKRLNEFEFDFPVQRFDSEALSEILEDKARLQYTKNKGWEGMMNGKIDMLFEYGTKYYVLDWKSTYLGSGMTDYGARNLESQMSLHNYHLQYLIYTVATVKYLKDRLGQFDYERDFGGVIYFFVRGVRLGSSSGIYFKKPDPGIINALLNLWEHSGTEMIE